VSDRFGARHAIRLFTVVAIAGYVAYLAAWTWPVLFVGLAGAMAWKAGAFPATFAFIGQNLPPGRRVAGFTIQSLAVRIPRVVAAPVGGVLMSRLGLVEGVRVGAAVAVLAGCAVLRDSVRRGRVRGNRGADAQGLDCRLVPA
jgi:predicted MFS family arabinose efflux permease